MRFDARLRERASRLALVPQAGKHDAFRIKALDGGEAEVWLYDEISFWGVTARDFVAELRQLEADRITLHINSPGGDVFDGIAIYSALKAHKAEVTSRVEGLAASIASVIAMAGRVVMAEHSTMMIHDPWGLTIGDAADHLKQAAILNQIGDEIASIYAQKADNGTRHDQQIAKWRARMLEETWYTDQGAVDAGLADEVDKAAAAAAQNAFDLSIFTNCPAALRAPAASAPHQPAHPAAPTQPHALGELEELLVGLRRLRAA